MKTINKKLIVFLIVLILILIIIINIFSSTVNTKGERKQYEDENISIKYNVTGKYKPSVINTEYSRLTRKNSDALDNTIDYILDCINTRKYEELYDKLNEEYSSAKFKDLEDFEEKLNKKYNASDYSCTSFRLKGSYCYINIKSSTQTSGESLEEIKVFNYTDIDSMKVYFDDIQRIEKIEELFTISDLSMKTRYLISYADRIGVNLEISNPTNNDIELNINEFGLITVFRGAEEGINTPYNEKITIPAKQTVLTEICIESEEPLIYLPSFITLKLTADGETQDFKLLVNYDEGEIEE